MLGARRKKTGLYKPGFFELAEGANVIFFA